MLLFSIALELIITYLNLIIKLSVFPESELFHLIALLRIVYKTRHDLSIMNVTIGQ